MSAIDELVGALVASGMPAGAAAAMVARAVIEANASKPSSGAARTRRWRANKASQSVTCDVTSSQEPRDEKASQGVTVTSRVTRPLSNKKEREHRASQRRSTLPATFLLSEVVRGYAVSKGLDPPRIPQEFEHFCDHHRAKGSLFADWEAAWRTWVRRAVDYAKGKNGSANGEFKWRSGMEGIV